MVNGTTRKGFTLIELLVVMSIIGVLMALLFPALQEAKKLSDQTDCKNQQRSLALACLTYGESYQGWFPQNVAVPVRTQPASKLLASQGLGVLFRTGQVTNKRAFMCKSDTGDETKIDTTGFTATGATSYGYSATHKGNDESDVGLVGDSTTNTSAGVSASAASCHSEVVGSGATARGKFIIAFCDGHVEMFDNPLQGHTTDPASSTAPKDDVYGQNTTAFPVGTKDKYESWIQGGKNDG